MQDLEDRLPELLRRRPCREPPADLQVDLGAVAVRDERIGRLLDAVVEEGVGVVQADDQPGPHGLPEGRVDLVLRGLLHQAQGGGLGAVAQTGQACQGLLGGSGQAGELAHQEIDHIVGVAHGPDACQVPDPHRRARIECQEPLVG